MLKINSHNDINKNSENNIYHNTINTINIYHNIINTMNSPVMSPISLSPMSTLSPMSPVTITPTTFVSPTYVSKTDPLTLITPITTVPVLSYNGNYLATPIYVTKPRFTLDIDTGLNNSYIVQKDICKYFQYRMLDDWLFTKYPKLLKYLKVSDGRVSVVKSESEMEKNDISANSKKENELKADFIEDKILDADATKKVLMRVIAELNYKWFDLPYKEHVVRDVIYRYIKKHLKKMMSK